MEIMIYILPMAPRDAIRLVHNSKMRMAVFQPVPPVPARAVRGAEGKGL